MTKNNNLEKARQPSSFGQLINLFMLWDTNLLSEYSKAKSSLCIPSGRLVAGVSTFLFLN